MVIQMDLGKYANKKVLITGVTGFKGSWLAIWLHKLGAKVTGIADGIKTEPSLFKLAGVAKRIEYIEVDVRDSEKVRELIEDTQPDFVFHLAAQAIVSESKRDPIYTLETNTLGTANILNSLRKLEHECAAVFITSDKCYENKEWLWGYRESDLLGGKDIYSASKAAAELVISAFVRTYYTQEDKNNIRIATARAGNVIGGGDWSQNRIVVDCVTKWSKNEEVVIRSPDSTRPWQHVLEPLGGYLLLALKLAEDVKLHGESFNFGPRLEKSKSVLDLIDKLNSFWNIEDGSPGYKIINNSTYNESGLLQLNCEKALQQLNWAALLDFETTCQMTAIWYSNFYYTDKNIEEMTLQQIEYYERNWAKREL